MGESYLDMGDIIQINFTWELPKKYPILGEYPSIDVKTGIQFVDNFNIYGINSFVKKTNINKGDITYI